MGVYRDSIGEAMDMFLLNPIPYFGERAVYRLLRNIEFDRFPAAFVTGCLRASMYTAIGQGLYYNYLQK